jgi:hypothetical protein
MTFDSYLALALFAVIGSPACSVDPDALTCRLRSTLHWLDVLAIVLAAVFLLVTAMALVACRHSSKAKLTPDDD